MGIPQSLKSVAQRFKRFGSKFKCLKKRDRSNTSTKIVHASSQCQKTSTTYQVGLNEEDASHRDKLLQALLNAPMHVQLECLKCFSRSEIHASKNAKDHTSNTTTPNFPTESNDVATTAESPYNRSHTSENMEDVTQKSKQCLTVSPLQGSGQLEFHNELANRLVLVKDGESNGVALMLSRQVCDWILEVLEGNRDFYSQGKQREVDGMMFDKRLETINNIGAQLKALQRKVHELTLNGPTEAQVEALTILKSRERELSQARVEVNEKDSRAFDNFEIVKKEQLQRSWRMCCAVDDAFVTAGLLPAIEYPNFEDRTPKFDNTVLEDLSVDIHALDPSNVKAEPQVNDNDADTVDLVGLSASGENCRRNWQLYQKAMQDGGQQYLDTFLSEHPDDLNVEEYNVEQSDHEDDQVSLPIDEGFQIAPVSSESKDLDPISLLLDDAHWVPHQYDMDDMEILRQEQESEAVEKQETELPWSSLEYGYQHIPNIGFAEVLPLGQWAPLLGNRETLRADVWKYSQEALHCSGMLDEVQVDMDIVKEEHETQYCTGDAAAELDTRRNAVARIEERLGEIGEHLRLCEARQSIAMFRARWMGLDIDEDGRCVEDESDYFADGAMDSIFDFEYAQIESWRDGILHADADLVEEPELDEWGNGEDEVQPWDNLVDRWSSYEAEVKDHFSKMQNSGQAPET